MGAVFSMMLFPLLTTDECVVAAIAASGNVLNDPGAGKRIKNEWYLTKKYGRVKCVGWNGGPGFLP